MPSPLPKRDHHIPPGEAVRLTAARRRRGGGAGANPSGEREHTFAFHRLGVDRVLAQPGCVGVRVYPGVHADGAVTWVLVGVDEAGRDIAEGELLQDPIWCPPDCDEVSPLATDR